MKINGIVFGASVLIGVGADVARGDYIASGSPGYSSVVSMPYSSYTSGGGYYTQLPAPSYSATKCPATSCYKDSIPMECPPGKLCAEYLISVNACAWGCDQPPPEGCKPRCKPCKAEVCIDLCECEVVCSSGPCGP